MTVLNVLRTALRGITASKLRAGLTTLGIVIGVASVIAMLALGNGARAAVEASFRFLGSDTIRISVNLVEMLRRIGTCGLESSGGTHRECDHYQFCTFHRVLHNLVGPRHHATRYTCNGNRGFVNIRFG